MDTTQIIAAVKELAASKSISEADVCTALEEALQKTYLKVLGGFEDLDVYCHVDLDTGVIELGQYKMVTEDVEDDYLQIEPEDAEEILGRKVKSGEKVFLPAALEDFSKALTMAVKSNLRQRLAEAERSALYDIYKDHIGEMMVGVVTKADDRFITIEIGHTSIELTRRELIGDEYFKVGETIKVYIQEVKSVGEQAPGKRARGPQIEATRASEGFLKRLFEEEIHEIYDGTVIIKGIARQAGVRSKIAVYSTNDDVDATGACIGAGGSRIQKIVSQLGNGKVNEKIDIINYSPYTPLFIMEAVRPVSAIGIVVDEENLKATVIVSDENYPQVSRFRANQSLAAKLTGYKIEFIPEDRASGLDYITMEMASKLAEEAKRNAEREAYARRSLEEARRREEARRLAEEEAARKAAEEEAARRAAEEEEAKRRAEAERQAKPTPAPAPTPVPPKASANPEEFPAEAINPAAAALAAVAEAKRREEEEAARRAAETPVEEEAPAPVEETEVKTTTTLSELESELNESHERQSRGGARGTKRPRKITEEEVRREPIKPTAPASGMAIYTEEELAAMNEEDENDLDLYDMEEESDIDEEYNEYDRYYDDEN